MSTMPEIAGEVILGVDTHEREHVAALVDERGRLLATGSFPATVRGFRMLLAWAREHGPVYRAGVEGTGSFRAGLTRFLADERVQVVEVTRPNRRGRRHLGKSDTVDAEAAARMVLSGEATATPKRRDGIVESIRVLRAFEVRVPPDTDVQAAFDWLTWRRRSRPNEPAPETSLGWQWLDTVEGFRIRADAVSAYVIGRKDGEWAVNE